MFYIGIYREKLKKIFLSETDIWYVAIPSRPHQVCSNNALGAKMARPRCHQGHGQVSTDSLQNSVSDLGPLGPLV